MEELKKVDMTEIEELEEMVCANVGGTLACC